MKKLIIPCLCIAVLFVLIGCELTSQSGPDPEPAKVFTKFIGALEKNDYETAWNLLATDSKERFKENGQPSMEKFKAQLAPQLKDEKRRKEIFGATPGEIKIMAVLTIHFKDGDKERTEEVPLIKENGQWKVGLD